MTIRLPEDVIENLHEYARFLGSSLDHVVIEALRLVFKKDSEFRAWQIHQPTAPPKAVAVSELSATPFSLQVSQYKHDGNRATGEKRRES